MQCFRECCPEPLRSRHRSPRSSPGRSTGRRLRSHLLLLFQTVRASHRALPVPSCGPFHASRNVKVQLHGAPVDKVERHAVRIECRKYDARLVSDHTVNIMKIAVSCHAAAAVCFRHITDLRCVCLIGGNNVFHFKPRRLTESSVILPHIRRIVASAKS